MEFFNQLQAETGVVRLNWLRSAITELYGDIFRGLPLAALEQPQKVS